MELGLQTEPGKLGTGGGRQLDRGRLVTGYVWLKDRTGLYGLELSLGTPDAEDCKGLERAEATRTEGQASGRDWQQGRGGGARGGKRWWLRHPGGAPALGA